MTSPQIKPRFLYTADGKKSDVLLGIEEFERLIDALEEARDILDFDEAVATATDFVDLEELRRQVFGP